MSYKKSKALVLAALVGTTAACQDLEVTNLNLPDTERALSSADAVQAVIESSFTIWWGRMHNNGDVYNFYPEIADEFTRTWQARGVQPSFEPRLPLNNDPEAPSVWIPRATWDGFPSGAANTNDAIRVIQNGLRIVVADDEDGEVQDQTDRAMAFARIWQGINLGYLALVHDQAAYADETTFIDDPVVWEREALTPWDEIIPKAVEKLEMGIEIAETGEQWTLAPSFIHQQTYNNQEMIQFAHTMIARIMIYSARTPEQRAALDWGKILFHTERGLTFDIGPILESGVITTTGWGQRVFRLLNNQQMFRVDPRILGMADVSGVYLDWLATSRDEREGFIIETPDRRFQGPDGPDQNGAYIRRDTAPIIADRGLYNQSFYSWYRRAAEHGASWTTGLQAIATAEENRLYMAEAHLRLGNLQQAADIINETRTRGVTIGTLSIPSNLPPVTANGVPQSDTCVPRANFGMAPIGQCGTLEDALFYERSVQLMGLDPLRAWLDYRGFGFLQAGTPYHMPIPGRYIVSIGIPLYSFGGVGGDGAAAGPAGAPPGTFGPN